MPETPHGSRIAVARALTACWRFKSLAIAKWAFRDVPDSVVLTRPLFGGRFAVDASRSVTHQLLYLEGERMIGERHLIGSLLRPGMRVVDVGANIGYYVMMCEQIVGAEGEIICFEPEPANLIELKRNISQNGFRNVVLHEAAVGERHGTAGLQAGINSRVVGAEEGDYAVDVRSLDDVCSEKVDFIKIDVDGYEAHVLLGAREMLKRDHPSMFLEFHPHHIRKFGYSFDDVYEILTAAYDEITFYEMPESRGALAKVAERYLGRDPVRRIDDADALIADTRSGRRQRTYWIVARQAGKE